MNNNEMHGENVVPLFLSFSEMKRTEDEVLKRFAEEWEAAYVKLDLVQAVLAKDEAVLTKFADTEIALAKKYVETHGSNAHYEALAETVYALKGAAERRDSRLFGIGEVAKRSQRFAMAASRRHHGPAAVVISIEGKR